MDSKTQNLATFPAHPDFTHDSTLFGKIKNVYSRTILNKVRCVFVRIV